MKKSRDNELHLNYRARKLNNKKTTLHRLTVKGRLGYLDLFSCSFINEFLLSIGWWFSILEISRYSYICKTDAF
jgi:hypothetical protein